MTGSGSGSVREFTLPDLGEGLAEAEIVRWLVEVGDLVAVDQAVVEVETAKAVVEVPCPYGGVVTRLWGGPGESLDVGSPLVSVAEGGGGGADSDSDFGSDADSVASGNVLVGYGTYAVAGRRRRLLPEPSVGGRGGPVRVLSPLVRRLARESGVDLRAVRGSGPEGLILRADVVGVGVGGVGAGVGIGLERVPEAVPETVPEAVLPVPVAPVDAPEVVRVPLRGVRKAVAEKLSRSHREIPAATVWVDVDATRLLEVRERLAASGGPRVVLSALLARICVAALREFPELNSTVDTERQEIVRFPAVHLGLAAQTERGLMVPVVKDAQSMTLPELSAEITRLTGVARDGTVRPAELSGGTFTLNNYGVFGVDGSTPILNHPEAAMLGVGRILPRGWVVDGRLEVRQVCQLSLTFDHRVCDGGSAAGFLRKVADLMEEPLGLLRLL